MWWTRSLRVVAVSALLGTGLAGGRVLAGPTLEWTEEFSASSGAAYTDHAVNVASSLTHAYVVGPGRDSSTAGAYYLIQYDLSDGTQYSTASFSSFSGTYDAVCMASYHVYDYNGDPVILTGGVQESFIIVAGTTPLDGGQHVPAVAAFHTDPDNSGELALDWSWTGTVTSGATEVPVGITTDGTHVALVSKLTGAGYGTDVVAHAFDLSDGSELMYGYYSSTGSHNEVAVGVALDENFVIVGGHGWNGSGHPQDMMALAFNIDYYGPIPPGTVFGPTFISPGAGRSFEATCFTAGGHSQYNGPPPGGSFGGVRFAIGGKSWCPGCQGPSASDYDWMIDTFQLDGSGSSMAPSARWSSFSAGKSISSFNDVPIAMCITVVKVDYDCNSPGGDIIDYPRLWVTGARTPVGGGPAETTTVQFKNDDPDAAIEWYDHFTLSDNSGQINVRPTAISAGLFPSESGTPGPAHGLTFRIFVAGTCDSPDASPANTDLIMLKYDPSPTLNPGDQKNNLWFNSEPIIDVGGRNDLSTGTIAVRLPDTPGEDCIQYRTNRKLLITGWHNNNTTGDNFFTACMTDDHS